MADEKFELTRRKALAGLGTIGAASAGAGLGTSAYFNDTESFTNNSVEAGQLDLIVDYYTSSDQGQFGSSFDSGEIGSGDSASYSYNITDAKPGDSGKLVFCPKVVDNPAYLWIGSGDGGLVNYENGATEPEAEVDGTVSGTIGGSNDGAGDGELSDNINVAVSYCSNVSASDTDDDGVKEISSTIERTFVGSRPAENSGKTLTDLASDLSTGFQLDGQGADDGSTDALPASSDGETQNGLCICVEWAIPGSVENIIQTDAVEFPFELVAQQERHNSGSNPFTS